MHRDGLRFHAVSAMNTPSNPAIAYKVTPYTPVGATTPVLFLLPPSYGNVFQLQIPLLWTGAGDITNSSNQYANANFSFSLVQQPQTGAPTPANVYASIGLALGSSPFIADTAGRLALMASFVDFLQNLETQFEIESKLNPTPILVPGATFRIGQQIADNLPVPLVDSLFYRYSLSSGLPPLNGNAYVDLRPGMRMRVETEMKQFTPTSTAANFYVGSGRFEYYLSSIPNPAGPRQIVFDPFLGAIRTPQIKPASGTPLVAGGLFDLQPVSGLQTYWRMFYPQSVPPPSANGDTQIGDNVALIGAPTLAALNQATSAYPNASTQSLAAVFLGRAVIVPEIPIWLTLNGQSALEYVSLGSTLTQIIERFTPVPLDTSQQLVTLQRPMAVNDLANWRTTMVSQPVIPAPGALALSAALFDVPLIAGDSVALSL